ncbi:MAG: TolC family protein [bacterium]|nr:TolC family protein [bacterium]
MRAGSPELRALAAVVAAREQVRLANAGRGPVVQLSADYAVQAQWDTGPLPGEDEAAASSQVALAVQLPIFDGGRTSASLSSARAELQSARLELERALRDRELAVRRAALSLESALAALAGAQETVRLAQETHRLAVVRLDNGVGTPLERLDAERALATSRAQLASALHASNLAQAAMELAVGSTGADSRRPASRGPGYPGDDRRADDRRVRGPLQCTVERRGAGQLESTQAASGKPVELVAADRGDLERWLPLAGTVEGVVQYAVASTNALRITAITVHEGDRVRAGDIVVRLAREAPTPMVHSYARALANHENLVKDVERLRALHAQGAISDQALDQAETWLKVAAAELQDVEGSTSLVAHAGRHRGRHRRQHG